KGAARDSPWTPPTHAARRQSGRFGCEAHRQQEPLRRGFSWHVDGSGLGSPVRLEEVAPPYDDRERKVLPNNRLAQDRLRMPSARAAGLRLAHRPVANAGW